MLYDDEYEGEMCSTPTDSERKVIYDDNGDV